jgi:hypothetical protein
VPHVKAGNTNPTTGNFPAFDQRFSDAPFWDMSAPRDRFASVAAGDLDYLTYKYARMVDVYGRRPVPAATPDAAVQHIRQASGLAGLQPGTPEFLDAQRRFLPRTMVAVPETELSAMRAALAAPGAVEGTNRLRTMARPNYQEIYRAALADAPIRIMRNGQTAFEIASVRDLASRAPSLPNAQGRAENPLRSFLGEGADRAAWRRGTDRLTPAEYAAAMDQLGRMAASRVVGADSADALRVSADALRGVGTPGATASPTEIWETRSQDRGTILRRFAGVLDPANANPNDTPMTRVATPQSSEASAHLTAVRALGPDPTVARGSAGFAGINAEIIRNGLLAMPQGTREALIDRIMSAGPSNTLELEIQAAIFADNPDVDMRQFLEHTTGEYAMTPLEVQGSAAYADHLRRTYGPAADAHFNADRLTYFQQPGVRGVAGRVPGAAGRGGIGALFGYGMNAGLDTATGRPVQPLTFSGLARDTAISVLSEEAERGIGAYGVSRLAIQNPALRGIAGKSIPGFIVQPLISMASERYSIYEDAQRYAMSDEEYNSRMLHAGGVGLVSAAAGTAATAGTVYIIGQFTAGGAAAGAPAGGVGAAPGAVVGFIVGAIVAAGAAYGADKLLPGGAEEYHALHEAEERERRRREAQEALSRPLLEYGTSALPLPFQPSPGMTAQEQMVIANWLIANAQAAQQGGPLASHHDPASLVCDPNRPETLVCAP